MKNAVLLAMPLVALVFGCATKPPEAPVTTPVALTKAEVPAETKSAPGPTSAEAWAEAKVAKENAETARAPREGLDPLAVNGTLEEAAIPKIELTPAKELRSKSHGDLEAGLAIVQKEKSFDGALKALTVRLGKPTWTENGQKRIWIAKDGKGCHRFVLDADGEVALESASMTEWRMLSALAQQNACTGEVRRGVPGSQ